MSFPEAAPSLTLDELERRHREVNEQILSAGGSLDRVTLVAVTKTFPASIAALALRAGLVDLGENYAQELEAKAADLAGLGGFEPVAPRWHFIGGLQRNKVKRIAHLVTLWQTVDRAELATEIASRAPGASVLVQVNATAEAQKSGCGPTVAPVLVEACHNLGLDVRGLMTVGPTDGSDPRPSFALLRGLADRLGLVECSMGMSGDIPEAVAEGSTMIRVGTALFGQRPR